MMSQIFSPFLQYKSLLRASVILKKYPILYSYPKIFVNNTK